MCIFTFINMCKCIDDGIGTFDVVRFHSKYNHIIYTKGGCTLLTVFLLLHRNTS